METPNLDEAVRVFAQAAEDHDCADGDCNDRFEAVRSARIELSALKQRAADLEMMLRAALNPELGTATTNGKLYIYGLGGWAALEQGTDGLPIPTPEAREALERA